MANTEYRLDYEGLSYFWNKLKTYINGLIGNLATKDEIPTIPSSLPANGGDAATVNSHTVNSDVPANAVFTDTQADWNASSGTAEILNKPTVPTITFKTWTTT